MARFRARIVAVGPEVAELAAGGIVILFAEGAPPELAEVSALHRAIEGPTADPPAVGAAIGIGEVSATVTALGEFAWRKIAEIGHVVINFDGGASPPRPGEISATKVDPAALVRALAPGAEIAILG